MSTIALAIAPVSTQTSTLARAQVNLASQDLLYRSPSPSEAAATEPLP